MNLSVLGKNLLIKFDRLPTKTEAFLLTQVRGKKTGSPLMFIAPSSVSVYECIHRRFPDLEDDITIDNLLFHPQSKIDEEMWDGINQFGDLYSFQQRAIDHLGRQDRGALLAIRPGRGKSLIAARAADMLQISQILVVSTLSLLGTWRYEIGRWSSNPTLKIVRSKDDQIDTRWTITNYDSFTRFSSFQKAWPLIVFDESILLKSRDALRSQSAFDLALRAERVWLLSGSPTSRSIEDLYQQFKIIRPDVYTSFWRFAEEYCVIERDAWSTSIVGTKPDVNVQEEFKDIYFSILPEEDVELPPEIHERIEIELHRDQNDVIDKLITQFLLDIGTRDIPVSTKVAQIIRLLQVGSNLGTVQEGIDVSAKTDTLIDLIEADFNGEDTRGQTWPMIIWMHWVPSARLLFKRLSDQFPKMTIEYLSSDLTSEQRDTIKEDFQAGNIHILIASLGVGKFGLTLTKAQSVVYYDRSFDADALVQSSYRTQRIGLDHSVIVRTMVSSVDGIVDLNLSGKLPDIGKITNTDWSNLLDSLRPRGS